MAGILCVLYTSILALPVPFEPVHLLFINLVTDSLPAIAIGMEAQEEGLLDLPPRNPKESIVTRKLALEILFQGGLIACSTMMAYAVGLHDNATTASTMAFASLPAFFTDSTVGAVIRCAGSEFSAICGLCLRWLPEPRFSEPYCFCRIYNRCLRPQI